MTTTTTVAYDGHMFKRGDWISLMYGVRGTRVRVWRFDPMTETITTCRRGQWRWYILPLLVWWDRLWGAR